MARYISKQASHLMKFITNDNLIERTHINNRENSKLCFVQFKQINSQKMP